MPFVSVTAQQIYDRMKADFNQKMGSANWLSRSFSLITIAVVSMGMAQLYKFLDRIALQLFPDKANEDWFPWHARFYGVDKLIAQPAKFDYTFTGVNTTVIPSGTKLQNDAGVVFLTDEEVEIASGIAEVGITAEISGLNGNIEAETLTLVTSIVDIDDDGTLGDQTQVGRDSETLNDWIARTIQRIQNPPSCGNLKDYERWAIQGGAERVWVYAAEDWLGPGTVGIVVATKALEAMDTSTKTAIAANIEAERPVSASYDVVDPSIKQITFEISITPNTAYFQSEIDDAIEEIFLIQSIPGGTMKLSQIRKAISNTGVDDYEITDILQDEVSIGVANIEQSGVGLSRYNGSTYSELT